MPVVDSNLIIDYVRGISKASGVLDFLTDKMISVMTLAELLVGCDNPAKESDIRGYFQRQYQVIDMNSSIAAKAAEIRRERRIKLPDAVILATAFECDTYLITRNTKDFVAEEGRL